MPYPCFSKIHKTIIRLEEIFHRQICIHFIPRYEEIKNLYGPPSCSPCTIQTNLLLSTTIMSQGIVIVHCPHVSVIFSKNFSIIKLDYLPIENPYIFFLTLWNSQNLKG